MWTTSRHALEAADRRICELLVRRSLEEGGRLYTREPQPERWSDGLSKSLHEVIYRGWQPLALCRLILDRVTGSLRGWKTFDPKEPPAGWQAAARAKPVKEKAKLQWLERHVEHRIGRPVPISGFVEYPAPERTSRSVFEGTAWEPIAGETILIRHNSETGDFMGWRHEAWFNREPGPFPAIPVQELQASVEQSPLFPPGMRFVDHWPSGDRAGHHELLWVRYHEGEEVENDTVYVSVSLVDRRIAECVINWSPLDQNLDLEPGAAFAAFPEAFDRHFPGSLRCGTPVRKYIEIPKQSIKPRVWAASAIHDSGPVQICIGNGGRVLRVDSVV